MTTLTITIGQQYGFATIAALLIGATFCAWKWGDR